MKEAASTKAFCMAPWVHLAVAANGAVLPCCEAKGALGQVHQQSLDEIWHNDAMQAFRAGLSRDEPDARCGKCYEVEAAGGNSLRRFYNEKYGGHGARVTLDQPPPPISLDVRFSNLCNFSCRMCWHGSSSKWFADARALGLTAASAALITAWPSQEAGLLALTPLLADVEEIYWAGGEPLLMEEHYAVLAALLAAGRDEVLIRYTSNLSELRAGKFDILALWQKFKNVRLEISVDGAGARGELIRQGLSWPKLLENIAAVRRCCPHVQISFGVTVSVFNLFVLTQLHRELNELRCCEEESINFHPLQEPAHYNIQILPRRMKRLAARLLLGSGVSETIRRQFEYLVDYMQLSDRHALIGNFRNVTLALDRVRGQRTAGICPELSSLLRQPLWRRIVGYMDRRFFKRSLEKRLRERKR